MKRYLLFSSKFTVDDFKNNIEYEQKNQNGIPDWVKNNAKWWSEEKISNEEFLKGIKYLIEIGIIVVN